MKKITFEQAKDYVVMKRGFRNFAEYKKTMVGFPTVLIDELDIILEEAMEYYSSQFEVKANKQSAIHHLPMTGLRKIYKTGVVKTVKRPK